MKLFKNNFNIFFVISIVLLLSIIFTAASNSSKNSNSSSNSYKQNLASKMESLFNKKIIEVQMVEELDKTLQLFPPYKLIRVFVPITGSLDPSFELQHSVFPTFTAYGIFAFDGEKLLYLSQNPQNLEKLLDQNHIIWKSDVSPRSLAELFSLTQVDHDNRKCYLLDSSEDILKFGKKEEGYVVNKNKLKKISSVITKPHWEAKNNSKCLIYYCLWGWMHEKQTVKQVKVDFDRKTSAFTINQETMEDNVFDQVPGIEY